MDDLEKEFLTFQARIDLIISLLKWIGGFVLAAILTIVVQTFAISFGAGRLLEKVENQGAAIQEMKTELRDVKKELAGQGAAIQEMKGELRDIRKDLLLIRDELKKLHKQ